MEQTRYYTDVFGSASPMVQEDIPMQGNHRANSFPPATASPAVTPYFMNYSPVSSPGFFFPSEQWLETCRDPCSKL